MRWMVLCAALLLQANVLELPVQYDPFAKAQKIVKKSAHPSATAPYRPQVHLDLIAIFNDKAYINGKFYTIGQKVHGYTLVAIKEKFVVLRRGSRLKIVPLVEKKILKTSER